MPVKEIRTTVYTLDEHPNKEKVFDWVRDNWPGLNDYDLDDFMSSLNALTKHIGGSIDYAVSLYADRGEFIRLRDYDVQALMSLDPGALPLTGVWTDQAIINAAQCGDIENALHDLHEATEYTYSDEGLTEYIEGNEYYFTDEGEFVSI